MKHNKKVYRRNNDAYVRIINAIKYSTSNKTVVRLNGDPDMYEPCFEILRDEGYTFTCEYIEGDLLSSGITFVNIDCKRKKKEDENT